MINGKTSQYKVYWRGNSKGLEGVGIFMAKKWVDKATDISMVNYRMIVIMVLI